MQRIKQAKSVLTFHKLRLKNGAVRAQEVSHFMKLISRKSSSFIQEALRSIEMGNFRLTLHLCINDEPE